MKDLINDTQPKISILIPVYNTEKYLRECLDSVVNQTLKDIEIVCVNDGSKDSSLSILNEYKKEFSNIVVIDSGKNEGLARARYHGINAAKGKYIMFLDSDDYLEKNACEIAYNEIDKKKYEIVHFGANVISKNRVNSKELQIAKKYFSSKNKFYRGTEIIGDCYVNRAFNWNLWTKIYKSEIVKRIVGYIPEEKCVMAEDMMIFFFISFYANKMKTISDKLINYRFGTGVSTSNMSIGSYESHLRQSVALNGIKNFLKDNDLIDNKWIYSIYQRLYDEMKVDLVAKYIFDVDANDGGKAFDAYLKYFDVMDFIECLSVIKGYNRAQLIEKISKSEFVKLRTKNEIKTIGIFYYRYYNGGVERVISKIIPILKKQGYKVVLFLEKRDKEKEFNLPDDVIVDTLPNSAYVSPEQYVNHAIEFKLKLTRNKIDLMLYQASVALYMLEEILICKSMDIPFVITTHDYYSSTMLAKDLYMVSKRMLYSMADAVQTITKDEEITYKELGIRAKYIPNPLTFSAAKNECSNLEGANILWVGRIDYRQKCPEYAIRAIKLVTKQIPNAKLHIIGTGEQKSDVEYLEKLIKKEKVKSNVILHGYEKNPQKYYQNASLFLMTSSYEVYPMVIGEAMSYGLPIAMFDLPYVELLKNTKCYLSAPQQDVNKLANNIISILSDDELRHSMGQESLKKIKETKGINIAKEWKEFIDDIANGRIEKNNDQSLARIIDISYQHWGRSLNRESCTVDHPDNYINMMDEGRFVIIDRKYVDKDVLYGVLLDGRNPIYKALFFIFVDIKSFNKKLIAKIFRKNNKEKESAKNEKK